MRAIVIISTCPYLVNARRVGLAATARKWPVRKEVCYRMMMSEALFLL